MAQGGFQNLLHCLTSGTAPFIDIRTGEMEDNPKAACATGTNIWLDSFKFPPALVDSRSLVELEYILLHQSLHTLFTSLARRLTMQTAGLQLSR